MQGCGESRWLIWHPAPAVSLKCCKSDSKSPCYGKDPALETTQLTGEASGKWTWSGEEEASLLSDEVNRVLDNGCLLW